MNAEEFVAGEILQKKDVTKRSNSWFKQKTKEFLSICLGTWGALLVIDSGRVDINAHLGIPDSTITDRLHSLTTNKEEHGGKTSVYLQELVGAFLLIGGVSWLGKSIDKNSMNKNK